MVRASGVVLMLALAAMTVGGCSHHSAETPQQQFLEALKRGNSAQASQIWLHMSPEQRVMFERGQGLQARAITERDAAGSDAPRDGGGE